MALTNAQLWTYLRNHYPKFKSETSEVTADLFTERGFEQLQNFDSSILNDFFDLSLRVFLQKIDVADVKDLLAGQGFGEDYETPYGGYTQRIAINSIKPVSPAFKGLQNGSTPDPFVVRKPDTSERFFTQNFDYQSLVTMPDAETYKNMFVNETGMSEYMAGIMKALANGYALQVYNNKLEAINAAINSSDYALKDTQKYGIAISNFEASGITTANAETAFASQFIGFIQLVRNIVDGMVYNPATGAFNQAGFETTQEKSRLKMLVRPTLANAIAAIMKLNNADDMSLPIDIVKVPDFGGLIPKGENNELLQCVYDALGTVVGYIDASATINGPAHQRADGVWIVNITSGGATADTTFPAQPDHWDDPNEKILAVIADKGVVFTNTQNPYKVEPIRNPRGLYTNFWASSVNNGIFYDRYYNLVTIENTAS